MFLRNVGIYLQVRVVLQPKDLTSTSSPPCEPQIISVGPNWFPSTRPSRTGNQCNITCNIRKMFNAEMERKIRIGLYWKPSPPRYPLGARAETVVQLQRLLGVWKDSKKVQTFGRVLKIQSCSLQARTSRWPFTIRLFPAFSIFLAFPMRFYLVSPWLNSDTYVAYCCLLVQIPLSGLQNRATVLSLQSPVVTICTSWFNIH
jgi:hypothetical protein